MYKPGRNPSLWRSLWSSLVVGSGILLSAASYGSVSTRIVSINGDYELSHSYSISVQPGDVVSFMADIINDNYGDDIAYNVPADEFTWSSDLGNYDECSPSQDCLQSNFEPTDYGVNFYVPNDMPDSLTIQVRNNRDGSYDQIKLVNADPYSYPTNPNYDDQYDDYSDFDYNRSLNGYGRFVYVDGERVFVPYTYISDWQPYQHGYWYYTTYYGWTWYSYDPWGWVTDHYGVWRYHGVYGWVWVPFPTIIYRPAVVTFFYTDYGIGWSPYYYGYSYYHGYNSGYLDGYWDGYYDGLFDHGYHTGVTYVTNNYFTTTNISNHCETNVTVIKNNFVVAVKNKNHGVVLGTKNGVVIMDQKKFVQNRGVAVKEIAVKTVERSTKNGNKIAVVRPEERPTVEPKYQKAKEKAQEHRKDNRKTPVGSVEDPDTGKITKPKDAGRGNSIPPKKRDGTVVQPNKGNPNRDPGKTDPNRNPGKTDPNRDPGKTDPNRNPGKTDPNRDPGKTDPNRNPGKTDPNRDPGKTDPNRNPGKTDPNRDPGKTDPNRNPGKTDPNRDPGKTDPNRNPGKTDPNRNPGKTDPNRNPGKTDPNRNPGKTNPGKGNGGGSNKGGGSGGGGPHSGSKKSGGEPTP